MLNILEIIGCVAGILTSFAFFPQIYKMCKIKKSLGISTFSYLCTTFGCFLWLFYGLSIHSFSLILFNIINILTSSVIVILSIRYKFN